MSAAASPLDHPMLVIAGPTASGKSALAMFLAEQLEGEIISCDSVAVYRRMDIGSAKPSAADRARISHHGLDLYWPNEDCTAGDYARHARVAVAAVRARGKLPIIAGGTGLYMRALLEGLAPAPPRNEVLREHLRARAAEREAGYLHRLLQRLDPASAKGIHANDTPKLIRSLEVTIATRRPQSEQWTEGRDPLTGFRVAQIGLNPGRQALYARIDQRAAAMFPRGLVAETEGILRDFGERCRAVTSLGYAQAGQLLRGDITEAEAIKAAQQGHRNYAKRQMTWFRREPAQWFNGFGDDPLLQQSTLRLARHALSL